MIWAGHIARRGNSRHVYKFWWGNLRDREKNHLEDPCVDGRIILRWIFRKWDERVWAGSIWLRIRTVGGHL